MTQLIIKTNDVERLLKEGKLESEVIGDSPTGRVFWDIKIGEDIRRFYYRQCNHNRNYYIREVLY